MINFYTSIRVGVGVVRGSFRSLDNKRISKFNNFQRIQGYHKYHKTLFSPQTFKTKISKISKTSKTSKSSKIFTTINTISSNNLRNFHSTQPTYAPLPAFLILFKSANAVFMIRTFSNLLLSFLPLALIKNPKTGQPRRILLFLTTVIPLTGFGILLLLGLEQAPHTNRWRFRFMSLEEEKEICNAAYLTEREKYQDKFLSDDRIETILVKHVTNNLLKGLNEDLMTLKNYNNNNNNKNPKNYKIVDDDDEISKPDKFEIFVVEDDSVLNAVSFGVSKKIIVFTGWLKVIDYNEEYLSVTLAHEIGHVLQRHASEALGFNQVMYIITDTIRTLLWWPILSSLGPLINDYLNKATQDLIGSYSSGRYNQKVEKEADIIGLKLMALSGYHPKRAIELWKFLSIINEQIKLISHGEQEQVLVLPSISEQTTTTTTNTTTTIELTNTSTTTNQPVILENINKFFSSHPIEAVRVKYLDALLPEAEKIYENVIANGGKANPINLNDYFKNVETPIEAVIKFELSISKIWNGIIYFLGLKSD
ncbi:hypothetical protein Glove_521g11 [Diversispora epigaea]|uniref:Peptidase M48 domain-containing protein n=1 Tax=Diversispora epigaea TaxID=1348612 RepID=A0A397GER5_9GLOM|nr:hypothetical protein Glove_521g11 [Diversispora epigaea]